MNTWRRWQGMNIWRLRLNEVGATLSVTFLILMLKNDKKNLLISVFLDMKPCIFRHILVVQVKEQSKHSSLGFSPRSVSDGKTPRVNVELTLSLLIHIMHLLSQ